MNKHECLLTPASTAVATHPKDDDVAIKVEKKDLLYDLVDLTEIFKVTKRTLFNWRAQNYLPLFELGGRLYISHDRLMLFIKDRERRSI